MRSLARHERPSHSPATECCTEAECAGLKNLYFPGKRLTPGSFQVEQEYLVGRRRLLNRAIHGWGVAYGFAVGADAGKLHVSPGLALDRHGRELVEAEHQCLGVGDLVALDEHGGEIDLSKETAFHDDKAWLLSVHYAEQLQGRVTTKDSCSCEREHWDRVCETVRYTLRRVKREVCCAGTPCELKCACESGPCCERERAEGVPADRGGSRCLCAHVTRRTFPSDCDDLRDLDECCGHVRADLSDGVPLACVALHYGECGWTFGNELEPCGPRRLVKSNELLFDLIRGCDLTRIVDFGWKAWHRIAPTCVEYGDFADALGPPVTDPRAEYVTEKFWVRFSRPVRKDSLLADVFAITILFAEREGGWWHVLRVPIERVDFADPCADSGDPADCTRRACVVVCGPWYEDAVRGASVLFYAGDARVEIEVRGDLIVDCNGQTIDANALGRANQRTGNGTPGGTFLSTFTVARGQSPAPSYGYGTRGGTR